MESYNSFLYFSHQDSVSSFSLFFNVFRLRFDNYLDKNTVTEYSYIEIFLRGRLYSVLRYELLNANVWRSNKIKYRRVSQKHTRTRAHSSKKGARSLSTLLSFSLKRIEPREHGPTIPITNISRGFSELHLAEKGAHFMVPPASTCPKVLFVFECVRAHAGWFSLLYTPPSSAAFRSLVHHLPREDIAIWLESTVLNKIIFFFTFLPDLRYTLRHFYAEFKLILNISLIFPRKIIRESQTFRIFINITYFNIKRKYYLVSLKLV